MAVIRLSEIIGLIRGSIGSVTFQKNKSGLIARRKPIPIRAPSVKKSLRGVQHVNNLVKYSALPFDTKELWSDFADLHDKTDKFGNVKGLIGANWFSAINFTRLLINESILNDPPTFLLPPAPVQPTGSLVNNEFIITNPFPVDDDDVAVLIYTTPFLRSSRTPLWPRYRLTTMLKVNPNDVIDLTAAWQETHSRQLVTDDHDESFIIGIAIQTVKISTGLRFPYLYKNFPSQKNELMKEYIARLDQSGTDAPVPIVIKNTLGPVTWSRFSTGVYKLESAGLFTANKTVVLAPQIHFLGSSQPRVPVSAPVYISDSEVRISTTRIDFDTNQIVSVDGQLINDQGTFILQVYS